MVYCPQALSEYKIPLLDIAQKQGVLGTMKPSKDMKSSYSNILFSGNQPSLVGFSEQMSFRHYLQCLKEQVENSKKNTFVETVDYHLNLLSHAKTLLTTLHSKKIKGQLRDFKEIIDVNETAIDVLKMSVGPKLSRRWKSL